MGNAPDKEPRVDMLPDPDGPPKPPGGAWLALVTKAVAAAGLAAGLAVVVSRPAVRDVGAALVRAVTLAPHATMGATVSARLEWESRERQIQEAAREAELERAAGREQIDE